MGLAREWSKFNNKTVEMSEFSFIYDSSFNFKRFIFFQKQGHISTFDTFQSCDLTILSQKKLLTCLSKFQQRYLPCGIYATFFCPKGAAPLPIERWLWGQATYVVPKVLFWGDFHFQPLLRQLYIPRLL